jgi:hypothetical protein
VGDGCAADDSPDEELALSVGFDSFDVGLASLLPGEASPSFLPPEPSDSFAGGLFEDEL